VDSYLSLELDRSAVTGPFASNPFSRPIVISPLISVPKPNSSERWMILDLSWPSGSSINDAIPDRIYLSHPYALVYLTIDTIALFRYIERARLGPYFHTKARLGGQCFKMAAPPEADSSEYSREFFDSKQVPWLKEFLKARGIQTSGKRKAELLDLCWKSNEIKVLKVDEIEEPESVESIVKSKLVTGVDGLPVNPLQVNVGWTNLFSEIPSFGFPDIYNDLVGECAYTQERLKSYKSLLGFKLYYDGHVENFQLLNSPLKKQSNYHQFRFSVRPSERSKLDGGETTYRGFFILKKDGSVYSGYCQCKGGCV